MAASTALTSASHATTKVRTPHKAPGAHKTSTDAFLKLSNAVNKERKVATFAVATRTLVNSFEISRIRCGFVHRHQCGKFRLHKCKVSFCESVKLTYRLSFRTNCCEL